MRPGQIQILSRIMMPLLILQFLLGMFANLFITFSTSTDPNPLAVVFTGGSPALLLHVLISVVLLIFALQLLYTVILINLSILYEVPCTCIQPTTIDLVT